LISWRQLKESEAKLKEEEEEGDFCPILMKKCLKEKCAWYIYDSCALTAIAGFIGDLQDMIPELPIKIRVEKG